MTDKLHHVEPHNQEMFTTLATKLLEQQVTELENESVCPVCFFGYFTYLTADTLVQAAPERKMQLIQDLKMTIEFLLQSNVTIVVDDPLPVDPILSILMAKPTGKAN